MAQRQSHIHAYFVALADAGKLLSTSNNYNLLLLLVDDFFEYFLLTVYVDG